jgi:hypothetical protein
MRRVLLLLMLFLCGTGLAYADPTQWEFVSWSGGDWTNGYPYYVEPLSGPGGSVIAVMCDDYEHGGQPGDIWDANVTNLGTKDISLTRFNRISGPFATYPLQLYNEAGWILLQTQMEQSSEWKSMNYAVWHIFDPNAPLFGDAQTWIDAAEQQAHQGFPDTDFNKVYIVTPTDQYNPDPNSIQEFLYIGQDPSGAQQNQNGGGTTPEPATLLMVGTGIVAMVGKKFLS